MDDILERYENGSTVAYRLGCIILHSHNGIFDVIDGQQRLVTLAILCEQLDVDCSLLDEKFEDEEPFLGLLSRLLKVGVEIRLIHAKEPGPAFREDFDKYKNLPTSLERMLCPRVHFKIIIIDGQWAYIGSANITGAGMGMKSPSRCNFAAGILTDDPQLVESAMEHFDSVWRGEHCKKCGRRQYCTNPIR